jgi:hypothetical protein
MIMAFARRLAGVSVFAALAASSAVAASGVALADDGGQSTNGANGKSGSATVHCRSVGDNKSSSNSYSQSPTPLQCQEGVGAAGGSY